MKKKISVVCLALILSTLNNFAQDTLSLAGALVKGLDNNFQIRIASQNVRIAENFNSLGMAGAFPLITAGLQASGRYDDNRQGQYSTMYAGPNINLRWTLFDGFSVWIRKDQYEKLHELAMGSEAVVVENTIQAIILAYYKSLLEKEKLRITSQILELSSDRYAYTETRQSLGSAVTYDVLQARNAWLSDSAAFLLQGINYRNSLRNLNLLMGEDVSKQYLLTDSFRVTLRDYHLDELRTKMFQDNKTLNNQYLNQFVLKQNLKLQRANLFPSLVMNSGADYYANRYNPEWASVSNYNSLDFYTGFTLSYTLFNGTAIRKSIENAGIEDRIGQLQTDDLRLALSNQLLSLYEVYNVRKQLYAVAVENSRSANLNLSISEEKYRAGTINSFNYRDVQLIYVNAAIAELQAIFDVMDAETELLRLTGALVREN